MAVEHIFRTPDRDLRWGWKAAILFLGTILFGIILNAAMIAALVIIYSVQGFTREQGIESAAAASNSFIAQLILSVLQLGFMLCLVRWLIIKVEGHRFAWSELGLINRNRSRYVLLGVTLAVLLSLLVLGLGYFSGTLQYVGNGIALFSLSQVVLTLLFTAALSLASGFCEEVVFRGYLQKRLAQRYNPAAAVGIVAVLFAVSHPFSNTINPFLYLVTAILVGILFGTVFARTGSLWMGIALHTVWNFLQIAILAVRNSADERFFGTPLFVFENTSGTVQMFIEFTVILIGLLFILWSLRPAQMMMEKMQSELRQGEFKARRFP